MGWNLKRTMAADVGFALDDKTCIPVLPVSTERKNLHKANIAMGNRTKHTDAILPINL